MRNTDGFLSWICIETFPYQIPILRLFSLERSDIDTEWHLNGGGWWAEDFTTIRTQQIDEGKIWSSGLKILMIPIGKTSYRWGDCHTLLDCWKSRWWKSPWTMLAIANLMRWLVKHDRWHRALVPHKTTQTLIEDFINFLAIFAQINGFYMGMIAMRDGGCSF